MKTQTWLAVFLGLVVMGCGPAISTSLQRQAAPPLGFAELGAQPEKYQGRLAILGGEVMQVQSRPEGSFLWVNQMRLDEGFRPVDGAPSGGTFLVQSSQSLAPDAYVEKRKVTVAGEVEGRRNGWLLLKARQIHLWEHPFELIAVPPSYYNYDKTLEYWYTPPYFDPYVAGGD
jgi:starvation-inducible outer membrane lipoprotein